MSWEGWLQAARARRRGPRHHAAARSVPRSCPLADEPAREDRLFLPVERALYRVLGVDPLGEQRWTIYALSLLAFSAVSVLGLFVLQRVQGALFLNPTDVAAVPPALAFNTAASFVTNTNWQNYGGESTMSHLTQMSGLAVQNFVSAAVGIAVAVALIRGLTRRRSETIGNFWVDLTRVTVRVLLPLSIVIALVLVSQGVVQNLTGFTDASTVAGCVAVHPWRADREPGGDQGAGHERRRPVQRELGAPLREPDRLHEPPRDVGVARHSLRPHLRLRETRSRPAAGVGALRGHVRALGRLRGAGNGLRGSTATRCVEDRGASSAGNYEGKEVRFGPPRRASSPRARRAPPRARSTRRTTASRRSAAECRSRTSCSARSARAASAPACTGS